MSEQTCPPPPISSVENSPTESDLDDLLDPYERLVRVEILGKPVEVPEKNRLLRCFQYLSLNTISYGDFCWNGDCTNCQFGITLKDKAKQTIGRDCHAAWK